MAAGCILIRVRALRNRRLVESSALVLWLSLRLCAATIDDNLIDAAKTGDVAAIRMLVNKGANVNARNGNTALIWACNQNHESAAQTLIDAGADVNARGVEGITPLHAAAFKGLASVIKAPVAKGAKVEAADETLGGPPLLAPASQGQVDAMRAL